MTTRERTVAGRVDAVVVDIEGRFDAVSAAAVEEALRTAVAGGRSRLVLNLKDVPYMSSAGLRVLLKTRKSVSTSGGWLRLVAPQAMVGEVIRLSGLSSEFKAFANEAAALAEGESGP